MLFLYTHQMSTPKSNRPGRPATGITKVKPGITIDRKIIAKGKKAASKAGLSFSAWVESAIRSNLESVVKATTEGSR